MSNNFVDLEYLRDSFSTNTYIKLLNIIRSELLDELEEINKEISKYEEEN